MGQQDAACCRLLVMERQVSPWSMSLAVCLLPFGWRQCSGRSESCTDVARNPELTFCGSESSATIHTRPPSTGTLVVAFLPVCHPRAPPALIRLLRAYLFMETHLDATFIVSPFHTSAISPQVKGSRVPGRTVRSSLARSPSACI